MNNARVIADAGVIVGLIYERDQWHKWTQLQSANLPTPYLICEAALTEACYLLQNMSDGEQKVLELVERGVLQIEFSLSDELATVKILMKKYANVPMSLADACIVRMSELIKNSIVYTVDSDFLIYRKNGKNKIPLIYPE
ncbi:MAG: pilus assembly protein [Saprospiraceae bacterium]|nr:pilus assembly protein [Pyrinomonadaceae bacterium]